MKNQTGFQGEFEFREGYNLDEGFGDFGPLPNVQWIHELAQEFAQSLELMPYQMAGEGKKLLVSVYIETRNQGGRVIAVLTRAPYPLDWDSLFGLMHTAIERLSLLSRLEAIYTRASINAAGAALEKLYRKMKEFKEKHPDWATIEQPHT